MKATSPNDMMAAVATSMKERTGKTLEEWVAVVRESGLDLLDQNAVRRWLKSEHDIPQNSRWAIADAAARDAGWVRPDVDDYIEQQYSGAKSSLRPIFERLRECLEDLGDDVRMEGRSTYIPFVRKRQFVAIAPATRTRVDVGLRYTEAPVSELIVPAKAPGQATHRISFSSADDINEDVITLLRCAYDQNG